MSWEWLFKRLALALAIGLGALVLATQSLERVHQRREDAASLRIDQELGMTTQQVDGALAADLDLPSDSNGLVITSLAEGRPAHRAGLESGDLVEQIGAIAITDPISAADALDANSAARLDLFVNRHDHDLHVAVNRG